MHHVLSCKLYIFVTFSETIFGYKGLAVELYYSSSRLYTYVNVKYDEIIDPAEFDGVQVSLNIFSTNPQWTFATILCVSLKDGYNMTTVSLVLVYIRSGKSDIHLTIYMYLLLLCPVQDFNSSYWHFGLMLGQCWFSTLYQVPFLWCSDSTVIQITCFRYACIDILEEQTLGQRRCESQPRCIT